jgi:hypothetical protein
MNNIKNRDENFEKIADLEKNNAGNDSNSELEEYMKIYESELERINRISNVIRFSQLVGIFAFLSFLVLLTIRVSKNFEFSIFYLLIPAIVTLVSFTIMLNMYLKLKDIFDEKEKKDDEDNNSQIGSILTYFTLNTVALSVFIYLLLICLRVENIIESLWNVVSIPFYVTLGIGIFYWIFLLPAFIQNKLYAEIITIFTYLICSFAFLILLNLKLDKNFTGAYFNVFIPLLFAFGLNLISCLVNFFVNKLKFLPKLPEIIFFVLTLIALILVPMRLDANKNYYDYWLPGLFFTTGYCFIIFEKTISLITEEEDNDEVEKDLGKEKEKENNL